MSKIVAIVKVEIEVEVDHRHNLIAAAQRLLESSAKDFAKFEVEDAFDMTEPEDAAEKEYVASRADMDSVKVTIEPKVPR